MFERVDFDRFHGDVLPARLPRWGALAARVDAGLRPLAFRLPDGRAWTYALDGPSVRVTAGDAGAATVVELGEAAWSDFVTEARTVFGLLYAGLVSFPRGGFEWLDRWEPALRALYAGRPPYDPGAVADVDLGRSFTFDDLDEASAFLRRAGFVHVRHVFSPDEIDAVADEVGRLHGAARADDGSSWWATDAAGHDICCRLIYATTRSSALATFAGDERFDRLGALAGLPLVRTDDRLDGVSVVVKNPSVVDGLSDLPWHRDCGLGGHPALCPAVLVGVQLDAANGRSGQLRFLAGSHLTTGSAPVAGAEAGLPIVGIDAEPGDVTVHFGHVLHVAPPPEAPGAGRRTMYVTYANPAVLDVVPAGRGYNDVLFTGLDDGHVRSPEEHVTTG